MVLPESVLAGNGCHPTRKSGRTQFYQRCGAPDLEDGEPVEGTASTWHVYNRKPGV